MCVQFLSLYVAIRSYIACKGMAALPALRLKFRKSNEFGRLVPAVSFGVQLVRSLHCKSQLAYGLAVIP
jgi:hypothetical protein